MLDDVSLPAKMKVSAVAAEIMISCNVNLEVLNEATGLEITDQVVGAICASNSKINHLKLNSCKYLTDFSLVTIGKHCKDLQSISFGGCTNIRLVGLRSLAMNCRLLRSIDFAGYCIDDTGLRIIAASLDQLENLDLTGCTSVTDRGLSQVAHCCTKLKQLKLGGCYKIGESGIWAFCELEHCQDLEQIELFGCIYLSDNALVAIARRCPSLKKINISECPDISSRAVCKFISICNTLDDFTASRCPNAIDDDVVSAVIQHLSGSIVKLDLSHCKLSDSVLTESVSRCRKLKILSLSGYQHIDDEVITEFSKCLLNLESLQIFESAITSDSVELLVPGEGGSGLSYLGLTGCNNVEEACLRRIAPRFKFSTFTYNPNVFVGFVPRRSEQELRRSAQTYHDRYIGSIAIQRFVRGMLVRIGIYKKRREEWAVNHGFLQLQALYRAIRSRNSTKNLLIKMKQSEAVTKITSSFRGYQDKKDYEKYLFTKMVDQRFKAASTVIQCYYRSHYAKNVLHVMKNQKREYDMRINEEQIMKNKAAISIQSCCRMLFARGILQDMKKLKESRDLLVKRKISSTLIVQRVFRGHIGRNRTKLARSQLNSVEEEWFCSRQIQSSWRGTMGRRRFMHEARLREFALNIDRAKSIQKVWRGFIGRRHVKFLHGLRTLNRMEMRAALSIQRVYRGSKGRQKALTESKIFRRRVEEMKASKVIQRVYRGYKGRELACVASALMSIEFETKPLIDAIKGKEEAYNDQLEKNQTVRNKKMELDKHMSCLQRELEVTSETKSAFVDSSILTGAPQRCPKEVVMATLKRMILDKGEEVKEVESNCKEIIQREKKMTKEIIRLKKKLSILMVTTTNRIKEERLNRICCHRRRE